ncbi:MAG TPA: PhzF family phenazine biosynthesis protein [Acidimicrobiales bacterium]|nr:PhzF family phenazine biosynthesis protein [Acidimicrobiales bacterium]
MRYRIVDVFSDRPLAGNALCVVLDPCPPETMQAIAREVHLSETTFVTARSDDGYEARIFTPAGELPFAGHPSVGTAWTMGPGRWTQATSGATVVIEADEHGAVMSQPDPDFEELDPTPAIVALRLPDAVGAWQGTAGGTTHLYVATDKAIDAVVPDMAAIGNVAGGVGASTLTVFRRLDDRSVHVRAFGPHIGIPEDPGTGSAAGPVGVLARRHFGTDVDITIRQGDEIGRPCRIEVHAVDGDVRVGGRVTACAEGRFTL